MLWTAAAAGVAVAALLAVIGYFAVAGFFHPPWHLPTHSADEPLTKRNLPESWGGVHGDPLSEYGIEFSTAELPGPGGRTLRAWFVEGADAASRCCLLLVHGAGRDRRAWLRLVPMFKRSGYPVLMIDCSGHGASDGHGLGISYGRRESLDVLAAARYLKKERGYARVAAVGTSQGAASSLIAAAAAGPEGIAAVVAENPFYCHEMLTRHVMERVRTHFIPWPLNAALRPLWPAWMSVVGLVIRWRMRQLHEEITAEEAEERREATELLRDALTLGGGVISPSGVVGHVRQPLLVMHSERDFLVPHEQSRLVFAAATAAVHRDLWIVKEGAHCALYDAYPEEYEERLFAFLNKFAPRQ